MAQTTLRLPDELHKKLKGQAERKGMTFNAYLLSVLWATCEREGGEQRNVFNRSGS